MAREYENVWDVLGLVLSTVAVLSFIGVFSGLHPVFEQFGMGNLTGHVVAIGLGFGLTEKGFVKIYTRTINALTNSR